jgi:hypothetical protein
MGHFSKDRRGVLLYTTNSVFTAELYALYRLFFSFAANQDVIILSAQTV